VRSSGAGDRPRLRPARVPALALDPPSGPGPGGLPAGLRCPHAPSAKDGGDRGDDDRIVTARPSGFRHVEVAAARARVASIDGRHADLVPVLDDLAVGEPEEMEVLQLDPLARRGDTE
jgi:hypothetical protein